jgi:hypothetical protein
MAYLEVDAAEDTLATLDFDTWGSPIEARSCFRGSVAVVDLNIIRTFSAESQTLSHAIKDEADTKPP